MPYHSWLSGLRDRVVLFTSRDSVDLSAAELERLRGHYAGLEIFENFGRNALVDWEAIKRHEDDPFSHIVALSEYDLVRAGSLRDRFGIPGQNRDSAIAFRDKFVMKERLSAAGIPVTSYAALPSIPALIGFLERHGVPVVVKPRSEAGSSGVRVIRSERDLELFLQKAIADDGDISSSLMVEKFVAGTMYHIDGLVHDGQVRFLWPSGFFNDCLSFLEDKPLGGYTLDPGHPLRARLQDFVRRVLKVMPTPKLASFHAEVFHRDEDDALLLGEIGSRTGGARINDAINHAFGAHLWRSITRGECGLDPDLPEALHRPDPQPMRSGGWLLIPPRPGVLRRAPGQAPYSWVVDYRLLAEPGQPLQKADSSMSQIASFVVDAENEAEMRERLAIAAEWFEGRAVIDPVEGAPQPISLRQTPPSLPAVEAATIAAKPAAASRRICC